MLLQNNFQITYCFTRYICVCNDSGILIRRACDAAQNQQCAQVQVEYFTQCQTSASSPNYQPQAQPCAALRRLDSGGATAPCRTEKGAGQVPVFCVISCIFCVSQFAKCAEYTHATMILHIVFCLASPTHSTAHGTHGGAKQARFVRWGWRESNPRRPSQSSLTNNIY